MPTLEERKAAIQARIEAKRGPRVFHDFEVSHPFRETRTISAEVAQDAIGQFAREERIAERFGDQDRIKAKIVKRKNPCPTHGVG